MQLKQQKVCIQHAPKGFTFEGATIGSPKPGEALLVFVTNMADVEKRKAAAIASALRDDITYSAYPKAGQLETDLNRDILWKHLLKDGVQGVRQIAIDDVWSALRFRPKK